jgi:threonine synthase
VDRLASLGSSIDVTHRQPGVAGDPSYLALRRAVSEGALAFTCQGNENGLAIEGGQTLGYEMVSELARMGTALDRVFVQVGGGALASAVAAGFREGKALGAIERVPRFHAVQTLGGYPLKRAYDLVVERITARVESDTGEVPDRPEDDRHRADFIAARAGTPPVQHALEEAIHHRSRFMWPWEEEPVSVAHGILDDETYDWVAVVRAMVETGGYPIVVDEETLLDANELARTSTRIDVDPTGSSGLAGLVHARRRDEVGARERVAVLFTGVRR